MSAVSRSVLVVATILVATSCSIVQTPDRPDWRVFALELDREAGNPGAPGESTGNERPILVVARPESGAGYATDRIAYSRGAGELGYLANHRWADRPARMLVPLMQEALANTGAFQAVISMPTRAMGDYVVESEVLVFRQEVGSDGSHFRMALRVTLVQVGSRRTMDTRVFDLQEPLREVLPTAAVSAANRVVSRVLDGAAAFVAASVSRAATSGDPASP
ncbi:ABC-type transport auxiliary lipoprotein family protein [bacterium]|nr:ABC-type transport auxiliary lipoprotein family protein [bacterium]